MSTDTSSQRQEDQAEFDRAVALLARGNVEAALARAQVAAQELRVIAARQAGAAAVEATRQSRDWTAYQRAQAQARRRALRALEHHTRLILTLYPETIITSRAPRSGRAWSAVRFIEAGLRWLDENPNYVTREGL